MKVVIQVNESPLIVLNQAVIDAEVGEEIQILGAKYIITSIRSEAFQLVINTISKEQWDGKFRIGGERC